MKRHLIKPNIMVVPAIILLLLTLTTKAYATDQTAASCSAADIQSAIDAAVITGGGTITLPACDKDSGSPNGALWSDGDQICIAGDVELRLLGSGQNTTEIGYKPGSKPDYSVACPGGYGNPSQAYMIIIQGTGFKEMGNLTISGASDIGMAGIYIRGCKSKECTSGMKDVRIHHMGIKNLASNARGMYICQNINDTMVLDHMYIGDQVAAGAYGISITGGWYESDFVEPPVFGTDNGLFIEDSEFNGNYHSVASFYASRLTLRYNTFANNTSAVEGHGAGFVSGCGYGDPVNKVGAYRYEVYDNVWNGDPYALRIRSGHWIVTNNTLNNLNYAYAFDPDPNAVSTRANCTVANDCPWTATGYTTTDDCYQAPNGVYIWNNTYNPTNMDLWASSGDSFCIRENSEWYTRAPQTGDPIIQSWTPYTYPHPLASGDSPPPDPPPNPPTGVTIVPPG